MKFNKMENNVYGLLFTIHKVQWLGVMDQLIKLDYCLVTYMHTYVNLRVFVCRSVCESRDQRKASLETVNNMARHEHGETWKTAQG